MGSTQQDRSILPSGSSLPQWMKTKAVDRYDWQETFSPPSDDSFIYMHLNKSYRKQDIEETKKEIHPHQLNQDFSHHTLPCQKVLAENTLSSAAGFISNPVTNHKLYPPKPLGTDDGFYGKGAACGRSVLDVAHRMLTATFQVAENTGSRSSDQELSQGFDWNRRRGSKSLPVTPLHSPNTSPRLPRKNNRYFALAQSRGWLFQENDSVKGSLEDLDLAHEKNSSLLLAKPSELREMNFLSPTSM